MSTFNFEIGDVQVSLSGNSEEEIVETLRNNDLVQLVHDNFYFSRTTQQRTGNGWVALQNMNEVFIFNAFVARFIESVKGIQKSVSDDTESIYGNSLFISLLDNLVGTLEGYVYLNDEDENISVLRGLVKELRCRDEDRLNDTFDDEPVDVVSSNISAPILDGGGVGEPYFTRLSNAQTLSAWERL